MNLLILKVKCLKQLWKCFSGINFTHKGQNRMDKSYNTNPFFVLFFSLVAFIAAYYVCILLHEWLGHGAMAWILGQKNSPFDIYYGGWSLLHVDEQVDYNKLLATNQGVSAALIG